MSLTPNLPPPSPPPSPLPALTVTPCTDLSAGISNRTRLPESRPGPFVFVSQYYDLPLEDQGKEQLESLSETPLKKPRENKLKKSPTKMTLKADASEQVKFLVACINHTSNGRPDFAAVAEELNIVTKAAAAKRYERMLKAHDVSPSPKKDRNNNADGAVTPSPSPCKRKGGPVPTAGGESPSPAKKQRTPRTPKLKMAQEMEKSLLATEAEAEEEAKSEM